MRTSLTSTADLERKLKHTTNQKKRRAIIRVLRARWQHTLKPIGDASAHHPLHDINFGIFA
jgi:hypothetical protein